MSSINANQPEDTRKDLVRESAVEKIKAIVDSAETCFFCTTTASGDSRGVRPMSVRKVDDSGKLWFLSASDSAQNRELAADAAVNLYFQGSPHSEFLHLVGTATVSRDRALIKEFWQPLFKTWFTQGVEDPRITVICVVPTEGYYWDNKHGDAAAGVKMLIGAVLGKTLDDSVEGTVRV